MQTIDLTDVDVVSDLLRKAVNENGSDYTYPFASGGLYADECRYFEMDKTPSCIVGHVLYLAGFVPDDKFMLYLNEGMGVGELNHSVIETSYETDCILRSVQEMQDRGVPWGEAVKEAGVK